MSRENELIEKKTHLRVYNTPKYAGRARFFACRDEDNASRPCWSLFRIDGDAALEWDGMTYRTLGEAELSAAADYAVLRDREERAAREPKSETATAKPQTPTSKESVMSTKSLKPAAVQTLKSAIAQTILNASILRPDLPAPTQALDIDDAIALRKTAKTPNARGNVYARFYVAKYVISLTVDFHDPTVPGAPTPTVCLRFVSQMGVFAVVLSQVAELAGEVEADIDYAVNRECPADDAIKVGDRVRSFDFDDRDLEGERACYVEGRVEEIVESGWCQRYAIRVERRVFGGEEIAEGYEDMVYPPVNGTKFVLRGSVASGVERLSR